MSKTKKISLILSLLIISLFSYIVISSKKIDISKTKANNNQAQNNKADDYRAVSILQKEQEVKYREKINKLTKKYQILVDSVSQKIKDKHLNSSGVYTLFSSDDTAMIDGINKNLENILVPTKYKKFHLLLSRSLLKLSSYTNTANLDDIIAGLELFNQAEEAYSDIDIS